MKISPSKYFLLFYLDRDWVGFSEIRGNSICWEFQFLEKISKKYRIFENYNFYVRNFFNLFEKITQDTNQNFSQFYNKFFEFRKII
jgi:hypothetical protein